MINWILSFFEPKEYKFQNTARLRDWGKRDFGGEWW